jgi:CRISPR-associated exonuclease Cas4
VCAESDLLPISALQHLLFCERQCALIHVERLWAENRLTVEGRLLHQRAHGQHGPERSPIRREVRDGVLIARALPLRSLRLGLAGVADVVEFHPPSQPGAPPCPFPVEYKRGRPKPGGCDRVQLCAQALCLEEMRGVPVAAGALFYGRTRRRASVQFTSELRRQTEDAASRVRAIVAAGVTPPARYDKKCERCSLRQLCLPQVADGHRSAAGYLSRALRQALADDPNLPDPRMPEI